jgi:hypothetical protein
MSEDSVGICLNKKQVENGANIINDLDANAKIADLMYADILLLEDQKKVSDEVIVKQQIEISNCKGDLASCNGSLSSCKQDNEALNEKLKSTKKKLFKRTAILIGENVVIIGLITAIIFL